MADMTNGYAPDDAAMRGAPAYGAPIRAAAEGRAEPAGATVAGKAGLAVQLMGATMSLALLVGGGVWGYKLIVRDATGVPVVSAMSGPMREAPANPGGEVALHTGLSVNAVAALGEAAPPEDVLLLAPATADLTDEDLQVMPMAEAEEYHPGAPQPAASDPAAAPDAPQAVTLAQPSDQPPDQPLSAEDVLALADAISAGATPLAELSDAPIQIAPPLDEGASSGLEVLEGAPVEDPLALTEAAPIPEAAPAPLADAAADAVAAAVAAAVEEVAEAAPETETEAVTLAAVDADGRLLRSLRPPARPAALGTATAPAQEPEATVQTAAVSTTEVPVGTTLVQLGAFDTPDLAAAEWGRLTQRFAEFMAGKDQLIQEATSGGRAFYRLRATGFVDIADARRFCSALVAEDAACIPVVVQ